MKKEFVVRVKEVHIVDVIVEAEDEADAIDQTIDGKGVRGDEFEKCGYLRPSTWEVLEL